MCVCISTVCSAQNALKQKSFAFLSDYLDHHNSTDSLYFDYVKAYEHKAQQAGDLEKIFYAKNEYIVYGTVFNEKLQHAQELLQIAQKQNNKKYIGLAYNKIALVYYMERNMEQSLFYELKAESYLAQTNDLYNLNKSRYGIGSMYYFLGEYEKALTFFNNTTAYYKNGKDYDDLNGYLSSLNYKGKCYFKLQKYPEVDAVLKIADEQAPLVKKHHQALNNAYFSLLKGQNLWAQKHYNTAIPLLESTLPAIIANDDFANEHLAYLYIGKNLWALNQKEKALAYFLKIDALYTQKQYSDLNLLEAYTYLIAYYKNVKNVSQQLTYTERLLDVTNTLQSKNKGLSNALHTQYETHKLKANRLALQQQLKWQQQKMYYIYGVAVLMVMAFVTYFVYSKRKQKAMRNQYNDLMAKHWVVQQHNTAVVAPIQTEPTVVTANETQQTTPTVTEKKTLSDAKMEELLQKLDAFEKNKGFLNADMKLDTLAKACNTNAKYLSEVINTAKQQNFVSYINALRIDFAITQLREDQKTRKLTITALAEAFGFTNARSFSDAFYKITQLKPSYFISQVEKDLRMAS